MKNLLSLMTLAFALTSHAQAQTLNPDLYELGFGYSPWKQTFVRNCTAVKPTAELSLTSLPFKMKYSFNKVLDKESLLVTHNSKIDLGTILSFAPNSSRNSSSETEVYHLNILVARQKYKEQPQVAFSEEAKKLINDEQFGIFTELCGTEYISQIFEGVEINAYIKLSKKYSEAMREIKAQLEANLGILAQDIGQVAAPGNPISQLDISKIEKYLDLAVKFDQKMNRSSEHDQMEMIVLMNGIPTKIVSQDEATSDNSPVASRDMSTSVKDQTKKSFKAIAFGLNETVETLNQMVNTDIRTIIANSNGYIFSPVAYVRTPYTQIIDSSNTKSFSSTLKSFRCIEKIGNMLASNAGKLQQVRDLRDFFVESKRKKKLLAKVDLKLTHLQQFLIDLKVNSFAENKIKDCELVEKHKEQINYLHDSTELCINAIIGRSMNLKQCKAVIVK